MKMTGLIIFLVLSTAVVIIMSLYFFGGFSTVADEGATISATLTVEGPKTRKQLRLREFDTFVKEMGGMMITNYDAKKEFHDLVKTARLLHNQIEYNLEQAINEGDTLIFSLFGTSDRKYGFEDGVKAYYGILDQMKEIADNDFSGPKQQVLAENMEKLYQIPKYLTEELNQLNEKSLVGWFTIW